MSDLDKLIAAVEAGTLVHQDDLWFHMPVTVLEDGRMRTNMATGAESYNGSLDAAHRLHDALLPGWVWCPEIGPDGPYEGYLSPPASANGINVKAENPARAWLLAILRALKAKDTP